MRYNVGLGGNFAKTAEGHLLRKYMKTGDYITTTIYGHSVRVLVLAIHRFAIDVQRADGKCFRVSGVAA